MSRGTNAEGKRNMMAKTWQPSSEGVTGSPASSARQRRDAVINLFSAIDDEAATLRSEMSTGKRSFNIRPLINKVCSHGSCVLQQADVAANNSQYKADQTEYRETA
jgi:hypothetical protein